MHELGCLPEGLSRLLCAKTTQGKDANCFFLQMLHLGTRAGRARPLLQPAARSLTSSGSCQPQQTQSASWRRTGVLILVSCSGIKFGRVRALNSVQSPSLVRLASPPPSHLLRALLCNYLSSSSLLSVSVSSRNNGRRQARQCGYDKHRY